MPFSSFKYYILILIINLNLYTILGGVYTNYISNKKYSRLIIYGWVLTLLRETSIGRF
jgi:hypothetical protein